MSSHHVPDDLLMSFSAGALDEALSLVVATHLTYCESCRGEVSMLEILGGALLEAGIDSEPVGPSPELPADINAAAGVFPPAYQDLPGGEVTWPRPLHAYLNGRKWKWKAPGVKMIDTDLRIGQLPVRVFCLRAGLVIPRHTHQGIECTLVLTGAFTAGGSLYRPGDVAMCDESDEHELCVSPDAECICLSATEHPLVPTTVKGKLLSMMGFN